MRALLRTVLAALLLAAAGPALAMEARVGARVAGDGPWFVGQRIVVQIDLLSTGFTFSGQRFDLPGVAGVVLLAPGSAVLNLSDRIDGETWQGMRYELSLFVLGPGTVEVPPITVSFSVAAGYGSEAQQFSLASEPLRVEVRLPPGIADASGLVTTSAFEMDVGWEPAGDVLKVGDALTLTVRRRASDVPGAAFPPLEPAVADGLAMYAGEPEIADRTGRGELTGERTDRVTYMLQMPGEYRLPGRTLRWYDPVGNSVHEERIEALAFSVMPNPDAPPADAAVTDMREQSAPATRWPWLAAIVGLVLLLVVSRRAPPRLRDAWRRRQAARAASEAGRFEALLAACRRGDARAADRTLALWLHAACESKTTATAFADGDAELAGAVAGLQEALAGGRSDWSGQHLARELRRIRRARRRHEIEHLSRPLPALNPERAR